MESSDNKSAFDDHRPNGSGMIRSHDEAHEIVRALSGGEVDAIVVDDHGEHQLMALARLTDLDEINELVRALKHGEIDAFVASDEGGDRIFSVTPIHEVLAQQYHLTKAITDNATTALFILDDSQRCVFMNPAAEDLIGHTFDEIRSDGRSFHDIIHSTHTDGSVYPVFECPINEAIGLQSQRKGEEIFFHKDGHSFDISYASSPIRDLTGRTIGTVIEARDIIERKRIEQALRDADRRKDEFIATLAHELRNPLAPISNMLNLMKRADEDSEVARQARDMIERQLAKIIRLVDDLLDVSRITRNAIELRREPVDLQSTINDAVEMCRPLINQLGHSLKFDIPKDPVFLYADATRISQILGNLINNACKFTPGGGDIVVRAERQNGSVVVTVRDNGAGIPGDKIGSVFEMFAQVDGRPGDRFGGLGIGLALAKQLVEMHGGSIEAASEGNGLGSQFSVRLPVLELDMIPDALVADSQRPAPSGRKILVVDDNFDSAESMATLLTMTDNECKMAHSGPEAVNVASTFLPDVILLDIGLPGMDGYEVCREIRGTDWGKTIAIIAMTGWGQTEDRERSKLAGFHAHLVKPIDFAKLNDLITQVAPERSNAA